MWARSPKPNGGSDVVTLGPGSRSSCIAFGGSDGCTAFCLRPFFKLRGQVTLSLRRPSSGGVSCLVLASYSAGPVGGIRGRGVRGIACGAACGAACGGSSSVDIGASPVAPEGGGSVWGSSKSDM
eukprot:5418743-Prymnesium_polylepis.1